MDDNSKNNKNNSIMKKGQSVGKCSFCNSNIYEGQLFFSSEADAKLIICPSCVYTFCQTLDLFGYAHELQEGKLPQEVETPKTSPKMLKPKEIKKELDKFVIDQEQAKKVLSVAVYNHYKRIKKLLKDGDCKVEKSNVMLLGPTGCGKTLLAKILSSILNVPLAIADATTLTKKGYVGSDVESILARLIQVADYDILLAQSGIVYIDEIDKIAKKNSSGDSKDVTGEAVQQDLLKIIEGNLIDVSVDGEMFQIDTSNILFIVGGAFDGMEGVIESRDKQASIGFGAKIQTEKEKDEEMEIYKNITAKDIVKYGIIPELVGRIPVITTLSKLNVEALKDIIKKPENSILKQYKELLKMDNVTLEVEEEAITAIAEEAIKRGTGARALRSILEEAMQDVMFEVPSEPDIKKVIITRDVIEKKSKPKYEKKPKKNKSAKG